MASTQAVRPSQSAPRRPRDGQSRPSTSKRPAPIDAGADQITNAKKRRLTEPYVRDSEHVLRKHRGKPPSLIVHLHPNYFRFDNQDGSFAYESPMKVFLQHLRTQTVPHEMMEELIAGNVRFYDGCLIVEVHNHRGIGGKKRGTSKKGEDVNKFSMHNYNQHVTPSPFAPYPSQAEDTPEAESSQDAQTAAQDRSKSKEKDGPQIMTAVLHPTEQSKHEELLVMARTPASEWQKRKKGDTGTPSTAQPPTPQLSVPPTPGGSRSNAKSEKMTIEQDNLYSSQAEMLVATEPPLYLDPVDSFEESQAVIDMLADPLHNGKPPAPKERKRTTAEMEADDAQAAESERRMLIMDERIKPFVRTAAGAASSENQAAAASLGSSRFKTIEMVRQRHEENERAKKEEETRLAQEKRQYEEQAQQQQKMLAMKKQQEMQQQQRQRAAQQQAEMLRQQQLATQQQQQANMMQHGHPNQANMVQNQQNNMLSAASQGSPIPRQQTQTPMMQSSPMVPQQGGFPMAPQASNAGSPPRAASAMHPQVEMARNPSQQANASRNNTPQMANTPSMAQAMPGRQISQTPRMQPGSPAVSMPANTPMMPMAQNPQGLTPEQVLMLQQRAALQQQQQQQQHQSQGQQHAGTPNNGQSGAMGPEHFQVAQQITRLSRAQAQLNAAWQQAQQNGDHNGAQQHRAQLSRATQQLNQLRQRMAQAQGMAMGNGGHQNGMSMQQQMAAAQMANGGGHGHPAQQGQNPQLAQQAQFMQQMVQLQQAQGHTNHQIDPNNQQQQQALLQMRAQHQQQLQQLFRQHGGQIPQHVVQGMHPQMQMLLRQQQQKQLQARQHASAQAQARMQQQGGGGNEQYMQNLQQVRNQMAMQMGGMGTPGGGMNNMQQQQQFAQQQQQQQGGNLDAQFAAMANALQQGNRQQGGGQGMQ